MEFITSNKGSRKLCYAGHAYKKKKQSKTTMTWECTQRSAKQCKGSLITDLAVCTSLIKIITFYTCTCIYCSVMGLFTPKSVPPGTIRSKRKILLGRFLRDHSPHGKPTRTVLSKPLKMSKIYGIYQTMRASGFRS